MRLDEPETPAAQISSPAGLWRRNGWALFIAFAGAVAVSMGVFVATGYGKRPEGFVAVLLAALAWVVLASPVLAAGAKGWFDAILRGGCVADSTGVVLIALWLSGRSGADGEPYVTFLSAVQIYCIYAAVALAGIAAVRIGRDIAGRCAAAVVFVAVSFAAISTPMWTNGLIAAASGRTQEALVTCAVYVNPAYSIFSATSEGIGYVWQERGLMYDLTSIGQDGSAAPPAVQWYTAVVVWGAVGGILAATTLLRRRSADE